MYVGDDDPAQVRTPRDEEVARHLTRKLKHGWRARAERVTKVRQAVRAKDYENSLKLSVALDRLLDRLK